jgi:hypothetical protein
MYRLTNPISSASIYFEKNVCLDFGAGNNNSLVLDMETLFSDTTEETHPVYKDKTNLLSAHSVSSDCERAK